MRIDIREAMPGMILEVPVIREDVMLVKKGGELTPHLINRLKSFGITSVDIVSEKDNAFSDDDEMEFIVNDNLVKNIQEALDGNDIKSLGNSANNMVTTVLNGLEHDGSFTNLKYDLQAYITDNDSLNHSIRVAAFSILLAYLFNKNLKKKYGNKSDLNGRLVDLEDVAVAALLHDRGMDCYRTDVLDNVSILADNEKIRKLFPGIVDIPKDKFDDKYASVYSFCLINDNPDIVSDVRYMVLYSSEMENSNGPLKAVGFDKENPRGFLTGAKIIHLCSLYDDFLAHCVQHEESLENVISVIGHTASNGVINEELADLFLKNVPIYSVGNKVELSTGDSAIVIKAFTGYTYTTRPIVKVIPNGRMIDLRYEQAITIKGILRKDKEDNILEEVVNAQLGEAERRIRR